MTTKTDRAYQPPEAIRTRTALPSTDVLFDLYLEHRPTEAWADPVGERGWRASSLGHCMKQQTLHRLGIAPTRKLDLKTLRIFAWGDAVHDWVKAMYRDLGLVVAEEPTLTDPALDISGHADLICQLPDPSLVGEAADPLRKVMASFIEDLYPWEPETHPGSGDGFCSYPDAPFGLEIKSANSTSMKYRFTEGPQEDHRIQAGIYKHMSRDGIVAEGISLDDVARWFIVYVGKDWGGVLQYEVEDEWVDRAVGRLATLNRHWRSGSLPPCDCGTRYGGKGYQYCDYREGDSCCARVTTGKVARDVRALWNA